MHIHTTNRSTLTSICLSRRGLTASRNFIRISLWYACSVDMGILCSPVAILPFLQMASGQTSTKPQIEALSALSATGFQNVIMPVEDASVETPQDAHVYWISKLWWAVLLGAVAIVFVVIATKKRAIFSHQVSFFANPRCSKGDEMSLSMDNPMCGHPSDPLQALRDSHVELSMGSILQHDYNEYGQSPSPTAPPTQMSPFTNGTAPVYVRSHQRTALKLLELDPVPAPRESIVSCTTTSRSSSSELEITI